MVRDEDEKCELVFWYKRVREDLPVSDFDVSFTIQEEEALSDKNFTKLNRNEISENGFYFSVVSKCLVLHGYGEPFLDKYLIKRLKLCNEKKNRKN